MTDTALGETDTSAYRAEQMLQKGEWAVGAFSTFDRQSVLRIAEAAAKAAAAKAGEYADWAIEETGFGVPEHKKLKNELCSLGIFEHYKDHDYTSYRIDRQRKIVEVARPAGVVFALTPSANPVCSVFYKIMLALLTRNAIVISPHPAAKRCCTDAALTMAGAAEAAGAPDGVIQVLEEPNLALIDHMMKSERTAVILATGGSPMVRAAYSSGSPALGVGPGNCPAYVDASADVAAAARRLVDSKSFDNSVLCTNESAIIAHADISVALKRELKKNGCYLCTETEADQVEAGLFPDGKFNIALLGQPAARIARECGFSVPEKTRILAVPLARIGDDYPLSREKLCPVIGYYEVPSAEAGLIASQAMVRRHGTGHSAALHCNDPRVTLRFGSELNVLRIAVNAPCSVGAAGFETHLAPSMTVGTGFFGRSSIDENVGPQHLVQWVRVAFHKDEEVDFSRFEGLPLHEGQDNAPPLPSGGPPAGSDIRAEIRQIILEELGNLRAELV
jgi:acyl-CoA reductase-like NAD-dependent aldehyde dehydrogenase